MAAKFEYADKYVKSKSDIPKEPHWAIFEIKTVSVDTGYEGYNGTETFVGYEVYLTEEKWKEQIAYKEERSERNYVAAKVNPARIDIKIDVSV